MKALTRKSLFFILIAVLAVALITATVVLGTVGNETASPAGAAAKPTMEITSDPAQLSNANPNQEFTITVSIKGVANVSGGMFGAEVCLTPDQASSLEFVRFVKSGDVTQSATNASSQHQQGISVTMEGSNQGVPMITKDFKVGGFTFKLKQGATVPASLTFTCEDTASADSVGDALGMDTVVFTLNFRDSETTNTLSALTISNGNTQLISGTDAEQTITAPIAFADRSNIKITANRDGQYSKIKVVDSVGNKTLVSERAANLANQTLGELAVGDHTLTITVTSETGDAKTYTVKLTIAEAPVVLDPVTKPTPPSKTESGYTGGTVDFTPAGMADLVNNNKVKLFAVDSSGTETPVGLDAFKPSNVGSYKIVAKPAEGFKWSDEGDNPTYEFSINKAVLTATPGAEGGLPTFSSDSYKDSLADKIEYKYYTDETCTQEVPLNELTEGQSYYAKAFLKDDVKDNFEFDSDSVTQQYVAAAFPYTVPAKDAGFLGVLTKEYFGLPLWAWLLIALFVLLFFILLIILLVKRKKDKEEQKPVEGVAGLQMQPGVAAAALTADSMFANKTDKIEDRMHEMERDAHEREITRYREEAEKAKKEAELKAAMATPQAGLAATVAADSLLANKTAKIEDRMREIERDAHEREIARYRDEVERVKREAELKAASAAVPPQVGVAAATVAADSALAAKTERIEDRMHEIERDAHEREIARYREEVERIKREAELKTLTAGAQPVAQATVLPDQSNARLAQLENDMRRYEENLRNEMRKQEEAQREAERKISEERIAQLKADAEREIERMKEEARRAETNSNQPQAAAALVSAEMMARISQIEDNMRRREEEMRNEMRRQQDAQRDAERRSAEERIAQMKANAELEVERMREEARRAASTVNQPQVAAATAASTEMIARLAQLEENMKRREEEIRNEMRKQEDAQRELERKNAEERIAKMREDAEREAERIRAEAERMREEARKASETKQVQPEAAVSAEMAARLAQIEENMKRREEEMRNELRRQQDAQREVERKNEEERIAKMKADAEREAERIKAEAERIKEEARKAAEDIKRQTEINANMQQQPVVTSRPHTTISEATEMDAETAAVLRDYQDRMRKMEQELQEQRMTNIMRENTEKARKEMEEATKMRRHEEEMQRLRDLQDYERRQRQEMQNMQNIPYMQPFMQPYMQMQQQPYGGGQFGGGMPDAFARQQQELESQRLKLLEERLKQREMEVQLLRTQGFGAVPPQQPYGGQPYGGGQPYAGQPYGGQPYPPQYPPQYPPYGQPQGGYAPVQPNPIIPTGDKK